MEYKEINEEEQEETPDTLTIKELKRKLETFLNRNEKVNRSKMVLADSGGTGTIVSVNSVYPKDSGVVLQSNEDVAPEWSLPIPYVIHCLDYFDDDTYAYVEICAPLSRFIYDIVGAKTDESGDFVLMCLIH